VIKPTATKELERHAVLPAATASSFCVGYLNLRGWGQVVDLVEGLSG
jgi:hypothetical protein